MADNRPYCALHASTCISGEPLLKDRSISGQPHVLHVSIHISGRPLLKDRCISGRPLLKDRSISGQPLIIHVSIRISGRYIHQRRTAHENGQPLQFRIPQVTAPVSRLYMFMYDLRPLRLEDYTFSCMIFNISAIDFSVPGENLIRTQNLWKLGKSLKRNYNYLMFFQIVTPMSILVSLYLAQEQPGISVGSEPPAAVALSGAGTAPVTAAAAAHPGGAASTSAGAVLAREPSAAAAPGRLA